MLFIDSLQSFWNLDMLTGTDRRGGEGVRRRGRVGVGGDWGNARFFYYLLLSFYFLFSFYFLTVLVDDKLKARCH